MKILKNNYTQTKTNEEAKVKPYPRTLICEVCRSELEYVASDLRMGALGCVYVDCPCCGRDNMLEDNENSITLTVDNVEFPTHFWHTSKENGAVEACDNETVKHEIRRGIDFLRKHKTEFTWMTQYGNLHIDITRLSGDESYNIFISNDYYETDIPFEDIDYED